MGCDLSFCNIANCIFPSSLYIYMYNNCNFIIISIFYIYHYLFLLYVCIITNFCIVYTNLSSSDTCIYLRQQPYISLTTSLDCCPSGSTVCFICRFSTLHYILLMMCSVCILCGGGLVGYVYYVNNGNLVGFFCFFLLNLSYVVYTFISFTFHLISIISYYFLLLHIL